MCIRDRPGIHGVLVVGLPQAEAGFEQPRMAYLRRPYEVSYYATNVWVDAPARMLAPLLVRSLEATGLWRVVVSMPTVVRGDYRLDTSELLLQQEFLQPPSRTRLQLRAQLLEMKEQRVLGVRSFEVLEPTSSDDAYGGCLLYTSRNWMRCNTNSSIGDRPKVCSASNSSVTFIVPICAA